MSSLLEWLPSLKHYADFSGVTRNLKIDSTTRNNYLDNENQLQFFLQIQEYLLCM